MNYRSNVAALACLTVVGFGVVGCGGSSTPHDGGGDGPDPEPYAQPVATVDQAVAQKSLAAINGDGMLGLSATSSAKAKQVKVGGLAEKVYSKVKGIKIADSAKPNTRENDHGDLDLVFPCSESGSYHLIEHYVENETDNRGQFTYSGELIFDNCVHDNLLLDELYYGDGPHRDDRNEVRTYTHTGSIRVSIEETWSGDIEIYTDGISATNFTFTEKKGTKKVREMAMNGNINNLDYSSNSTWKEDLQLDGNLSFTRYDKNATMEAAFKAEAVDFDLILEERDSGLDMGTLNGYIGITESNATATKPTQYVYGEGFVAVGMYNDLKTETYDGILGTSCIGGTVAFNTVTTWETNSSMEDINGTTNTPFKGTLEIGGAEDGSAATVQFAVNPADFDDPAEDANKTYGTITVGGETSDQMSRNQMTEGICEDDK